MHCLLCCCSVAFTLMHIAHIKLMIFCTFTASFRRRWTVTCGADPRRPRVSGWRALNTCDRSPSYLHLVDDLREEGAERVALLVQVVLHADRAPAHAVHGHARRARRRRRWGRRRGRRRGRHDDSRRRHGDSQRPSSVRLSVNRAINLARIKIENPLLYVYVYKSTRFHSHLHLVRIPLDFAPIRN